MLVSVPAKIRTEYLTNTNPDRYSCANQFGFMLQTEDICRHITRIYSWAQKTASFSVISMKM
jgi:hypothetical protein